MTKQKATKKLTEMTFEHADAAVALVGPAVGGPANGVPTLVFKSVNFSEEAIKKMQAVKVTMQLPDFLERFFWLMEDEAEVLAHMMGYVEPAETQAMENDEVTSLYEDWIASHMDSLEVLKGLYEAENLPEALSKLNEDQYLGMLNDQARVEKAFKKIDKAAKSTTKSASAVTTTAVVDASTNASVEKTVEPSGSEVVKKKETKMTDKVKVTEQEVTVEVVEKAQFDMVQKALDEQKQALEKALATVAQFEKEKKEAIVKAKTDSVNSLLKDEKQAQAVLKAVLALDAQEDVDALLGVFKSMNALIEKSALFVEQGASASDQTPDTQESIVMKMAKSKFSNQK